jgi:hypothetical protein
LPLLLLPLLLLPPLLLLLEQLHTSTHASS